MLHIKQYFYFWQPNWFINLNCSSLQSQNKLWRADFARESATPLNLRSTKEKKMTVKKEDNNLDIYENFKKLHRICFRVYSSTKPLRIGSKPDVEKRCVLGFLHRFPHSQRLRHEGINNISIIWLNGVSSYSWCSHARFFAVILNM